ncbi:unnamed protein product [Ectocarpus sp. 12 AP-2014]
MGQKTKLDVKRCISCCCCCCCCCCCNREQQWRLMKTVYCTRRTKNFMKFCVERGSVAVVVFNGGFVWITVWEGGRRRDRCCCWLHREDMSTEPPKLAHHVPQQGENTR